MHSLHSYFLRPGDHRMPIVYDVDRLRDGRSFATRRVLARQHGRPIYALTASFQVHEEGFEHQDVSIDVPSPGGVGRPGHADLGRRATRRPSGCASGRPSTSASPTATRRWAGTTTARRRGRRTGSRSSGSLPDDPLIHQAALTYLSDLTLIGVTLLRHGLHPNHPRRAGGVAGPHRVVPQAVPGRRVAALPADLTGGHRWPRPRARRALQPRTAPWWPRWRRRG